MSSWRDASDPRCPECGEPVSATSEYCMHCGADFEWFDDSADASDSDDVDHDGGTTDSESGGLVETVGEFLGGPGRDAREQSEEPDHDGTSEESAVDGAAGADTADSTGGTRSATTERATGHATQKAPGSIRGFTAFVVSIPVTLLAVFILMVLLGSVAGGMGGLLLLTIFAVTFVYLVRKPLPSDIIGDAFYVLAGLLLAGPALGYAIMVVRATLTSRTLEDSLGSLVVELLLVEFFIMWPAAFFAAIGYAGNWWARKQLAERGA